MGGRRGNSKRDECAEMDSCRHEFMGIDEMRQEIYFLLLRFWSNGNSFWSDERSCCYFARKTSNLCSFYGLLLFLDTRQMELSTTIEFSAIFLIWWFTWKRFHCPRFQATEQKRSKSFKRKHCLDSTKSK